MRHHWSSPKVKGRNKKRTAPPYSNKHPPYANEKKSDLVRYSVTETDSWSQGRNMALLAIALFVLLIFLFMFLS